MNKVELIYHRETLLREVNELMPIAPLRVTWLLSYIGQIRWILPGFVVDQYSKAYEIQRLAIDDLLELRNHLSDLFFGRKQLERGVEFQVPTYYPDLQPSEEMMELSAPYFRVEARQESGVRVILGGQAGRDGDCPDVLIERRRNGWILLIHPDGQRGDCAGAAMILDNRKVFVMPDGPYRRGFTFVEAQPPELDNGELEFEDPDDVPDLIAARRAAASAAAAD